MQQEQIEKFKKCYSKLVEYMVLLHNRSRYFTTYPESKETAVDIRSILREIKEYLPVIAESTKAAHEEGKIIAKQRIKEERARKRRERLKRVRKIRRENLRKQREKE